MSQIDLREYKGNLRKKNRAWRLALDPEKKKTSDFGIAQNVRRLYQYKSADTVLVYVSTPIEVSTVDIIKNAWKDGKKVAVPRCIKGTRRMQFYYITSFDDLEEGSFSLMEPKEILPKVLSFDGCLMLLPAFAVDRNGYRLGYGMGYYDRFLAKYDGSTACICYSENVCGNMHHGRFDRPVDVIVTEKFIKTVVRTKKQFNG